MLSKILIFITTLAVFLIIDLVWLGFIARGFYRDQLGFIMRESPNWTPAIIFYLLYIFGLIVFVIYPALEKTSWTYAVFYGGLFGLIAYATYDLTNMATIKDWPVRMVIVDILWGTILTASTATLSYFVNTFVGRILK